MKDHARQHRKSAMHFRLLVSTATWVIALLTILVFWPYLAFASGIPLLFLLGGLFLGAVYILALSVICVFRHNGVAVLCSSAVLLGILFYLDGGKDWGQQTLFSMLRADYETQLVKVLDARVRRVPFDPSDVPDLAKVEETPALRVAFYWQRGAEGNWVGLVNDPTGEVLKANQFKEDLSNFDEPALQEIKGLFGGALYRARHLSNTWYLCSFQSPPFYPHALPHKVLSRN